MALPSENDRPTPQNGQENAGQAASAERSVREDVARFRHLLAFTNSERASSCAHQEARPCSERSSKDHP